MSRLLPSLLILLVLTAACGRSVGDPGVAVAVGDVEIPLGLVEQRYDEFVASPAYEEALTQQTALDTERQVVGGILGQLIQAELLVQALDERGLEVPTPAEVEAELDSIIESQFGTREAFEEQVVEGQGISLDSAREQVGLGLLIQRLQDDVLATVEVTEEDVLAAYTAQFGQTTASHILVGTQEEAEAVIARLEDGEDFATLAAEVSTDPGSGGQGGLLGPLQAGAFVPEFEEAAFALEPGAISDPVETQFGWHVITTAGPAPLEDVRDEAEAAARQAVGQGAVEDTFNGLLFRDDVVVNPRFGQWDALQRVVTFVDPLGALEPVASAAGATPPPIDPAATAPPGG